MATLTIQLSGSSIINGSKSWTVSDADIQAIIDLWATRGLGASMPNFPIPSRTNAQALIAWAQSFIDQTILDVRAKRRADADAAVTDVTFT